MSVFDVKAVMNIFSVPYFAVLFEYLLFSACNLKFVCQLQNMQKSSMRLRQNKGFYFSPAATIFSVS